MNVPIIDQSSKTHGANANVSQDFLLSPTFFLLFINDLPRNILISLVIIYADDIKYYKDISKNKNNRRLVADLYSDLS